MTFPNREPRASPRLRILLVDDEPRVLDGFARVLRRNYTTVTAVSGAEGVRVLECGESFAVIVSDMRMPEMDGATFLARARQLAPDAIRILLSGHSDLAAAAAAVNEGQIFRFLQKPCPTELLEAALFAAGERHRAIVSERVLLEETLSGSIEVLTDVLALANPVAFSRALRLKRSVTALADILGVYDRWAIELAAMLCELGALSVAPDILERWYRGALLDDEQRSSIAGMERVAERLIRHIPRLEPVREILRYKNAPFEEHDGVSYEGRRALPIGSRLLRVAMDYDTLVSAGTPTDMSIGILNGRHGVYDPAVLLALRHMVNVAEATDEVCEMRLGDVRSGMIFASDVVAAHGLVLIGRGQVATPSLLQRIRNHWTNLPLKRLPQMILPPTTATSALDAVPLESPNDARTSRYANTTAPFTARR